MIDLRSAFRVAATVAALACAGPVLRSAEPVRRIPAFPGAEGFGALAIGGRGGAVIEVTNLNDAGAGSLREACYAEGARIVVFRVGGLVELKEDIKLSNPYITIAGQTAPGDGICLKNATLRICTHDVVVRFVRARVGDGPLGPAPDNRDGFKIEGSRAHHVIVDHCSVSWSIDENLSTWGTPRDVTVQWCIVAEALYRSRHSKGVHGMGILAGDRSSRITFHHNLLAHNPWRNPYFQGRGVDPSVYDCRNNVIYDYGKFCTVIRGNAHVNYVANTIKSGPSTTCKEEVHLGEGRIKGSFPRLYIAGNQGPSLPDGSGDPWTMVKDLNKQGRPALAAESAITVPPVRTDTAAEAYELVLAGAGATFPKRDAVDERVVQQVRSGTGATVNSQDDVGGWPVYASVPPPADSDHDDMPDAWETAHGLSPNDAGDGVQDRDGDGYTNVEEYLNALVKAK